MINKPYKDLERGDNHLRPGMQFLIFSGIFVIAMIIGVLIAMGVIILLYGQKTFDAIAALEVNTAHFTSALWILQTISTTLPILGAPVFFAYIIVNSPQEYLKTNIRFPFVLLILVFVASFVSNPLIEFLSNVNQKIPLPHFLNWMKDSEKSNQKLMETMLQMKTIGDLIYDVLFIGLLTAFVEEFMFRGVMQTIFVKWTKNVHAAVWITAVLFSAFHMEYFGFLPRILLGALFGYFVAWSGSIWTSIWAHFLNNGTIVVITYLYQNKIIKTSPDEQHIFNYPTYIFSLVIVLFLLFIYRKIAVEKKQVLEN
jgi:membrane protease YdiL (CAAX protease family)